MRNLATRFGNSETTCSRNVFQVGQGLLQMF